MSKFAILKLGTSQYTIEEGKEYEIPKFSAEIGKLKLTDVLAAGEGSDVSVGTPILDKAVVEIDVLAHEKGEKITSSIFKAKSRYRRKRGFRKQVTKFKVLSIKF
jgi:large subunit ribosomal protein L21